MGKIGGILFMAAIAITVLAVVGKYLHVGFASKIVDRVKNV